MKRERLKDVLSSAPISSPIGGIVDFADIRGQEACKRAVLIALAGKHLIMLIGPSGHGKSLLIAAAREIDPNFKGEEFTIGKDKEKNLEEIGNKARSMDLHIEVPIVPYRDLVGKNRGTDTAKIRQQLERCGKFTDLTLSEDAILLGKQFYNELPDRASPRSFHKAISVARTIANLDQSEKIQVLHFAEAIQYRLC